MSDKRKLFDPWFREGLRFKCTECGQCCTGAPGYVWLTEAEAGAIAEELGISIENFFKKYVRKVGNKLSLIEDSKTYDCVFLKDKKCQVYSVRPKQCRTFPWWSANLTSQQAWDRAGEYCEGINHPEGELFSVERIRDPKV